MDDSKDFRFEAILKDSLNDLHDLTLSAHSNVQPLDFDKTIDRTSKGNTQKVGFLHKRSSLVAAAASVVLVIGLAIPTLISWQGGSDRGIARRINTTHDPDRTTPTTQKPNEEVQDATADPDEKTEASTETTSPSVNDEGETVTTNVPNTTKAPTTTAPGVTTTIAPVTTTTTPIYLPYSPQPINFQVDRWEKRPSNEGWYVYFTWDTYTTPNTDFCLYKAGQQVQDCITIDPASGEYEYRYEPGDTNTYTFYLLSAHRITGIRSLPVWIEWEFPA